MTEKVPPRVILLDTESDGLHPGRQPWEFAAFELRRTMRGPNGAISRVANFFIDIDMTTADPQGLAIGGFYDRHPVGRYLSGQESEPPPDPNQFLDYYSQRRAAIEIARITHGATIVGANPAFDLQTLERLLRSQGLIPGWHYRTRDVESLLAGRLTDENLGGLAACGAACGFKFGPGEEHTALGDALMAAKVYCHVFGLPTS